MIEATAPDWTRDGADWPNRGRSRFVRAGSLDWHVQVAGSGPAILLLHGTGAATHSWRGLLPLLSRRWTVVAPDLPGHGFTALPPAAQMSLDAMAGHVTALLRQLGQRPVAVIGHSAGAAIAARLALDGRLPIEGIVSINGALLGMKGASGLLYPAAARLLVRMPMLPWAAARFAANDDTVARLLASTGSAVDPADAAIYARLFRTPRHVAAALRMMAAWDLAGLDLGRLRIPVTLVAATRDGMVPPGSAARAAALMRNAKVATLADRGHLAHEEDPAAIAAILEALVERMPTPGGTAVHACA